MLSFLFRFHKNRQWLGLTMLLLSLLPFVILNRQPLFLTGSYGLFCLGVAFVSDYAAEKLTGSSYLSKVLLNGKRRSHFFLLAIIAGLILEAFATYFGHLWYYPYFSTTSYLLLTIFLKGFGWYFLCILLSYEAFKDILDKFIPIPKTKLEINSKEKFFFQYLSIIGEVGLLVVFYNLLKNTAFFTNFNFNINQEQVPYLNFSMVMLACFSFFCLFESVQHFRHRHSLLSDTIRGYLNPLVAILLVSLFLGLYMELQNVPLGLWIYTNWPLASFQFFGLPIGIFLVWPVHYILFLSFYRAFDNSAVGIWTKT